MAASMAMPPPDFVDNQYQQSQSQKPQHDDESYSKPANNLNIPPLLDQTHINSTFKPPNVDPSSIGGDIKYNVNNLETTAPSSSVTSDDAYTFASPHSSLSQSTRGINLRYQLFLDKISPHWKARWTFSLIALALFVARVVLSQGWYVICYALAIYYLNLLIGFISPKVDPSMFPNDEDELDDSGPMLPTHANDEFKPFIRRLPEFKFWIAGTKATLIALLLTLFDIFDVPVFWPILLIYFIILFACTMRQQIKHMIRYSYVPWDSGKKRYTNSQKDSQASLYPTTV